MSTASGPQIDPTQATRSSGGNVSGVMARELSLTSVGASPDFATGDIVGPYRIAQHLASGGFGQIYEAVHGASGDRVAVKVLHDYLIRTSSHITRFLREVEATRRLDHPGVIDIRDVGTTSAGRPYYAMQLLEGQTVREYMRTRGRLDLDDMWRIVRPMCEILEYVHGQDLVHRDLKLSNTFLHRSGGHDHVILLDFGIAKFLSREDISLTASYEVVGSTATLAPEQLLGSRGTIDVRTDVYGLGVMIFQMVTGHLPFATRTMMGAIRRIDCEPRRPSQLANVPPALDDAVFRALSVDPAQRQQRIADLRHELEAAVEGASVALRGGERPRGVETPDRSFTPAVAVLLRGDLDEDSTASDALDDAVVDALDDLMILAGETLPAHGMSAVFDTGCAALYIRRLVDGDDHAAVAGEVLQAMRGILASLQPLPEPERFQITLHRGDVAGSDGELDGPLLDTSNWPEQDAGEILSLSPEFAQMI